MTSPRSFKLFEYDLRSTLSSGTSAAATATAGGAFLRPDAGALAGRFLPGWGRFYESVSTDKSFFNYRLKNKIS
jgi:hypothetical protein